MENSINSEGLSVDVMGSDCTNGGATSGQRRVFLRVPGVHAGGVARGETILTLDVEVDADTGAAAPGRCVIAKPDFVFSLTGERRAAVCRVRAIPPALEDARPMFGGHFVWSSDSRFPFESPIPVHDRVE
jgi:hypothetical protein